MKPLLISYNDTVGGAARASYRLLNALRDHNIDAFMQVACKHSDHFYIKGPTSRWAKAMVWLKPVLVNKLQKLQRTNNLNYHSINLFPSSLLHNINCSNADVINLHWFNAEALSIKQVTKINKPIVMTLHDMWAFCGSEHCVTDNNSARFRIGYYKNNRLEGGKGLDIDRLTWQRKKKYWNKSFPIVTPSKWLTTCAKASVLFKDWPIYTIPNPLDIMRYKPLDKRLCREILGLPLDRTLLGFAAVGGSSDPNKGFDLLLKALTCIDSSKNIACVIAGQSDQQNNEQINWPTYYLGHLYDDISMILFYNAIDIMIVPSRLESFGQTASEPQACGTPVVAFNCTGLTDVVEHMVTGYLAKPFESEDLAFGIEKILSDTVYYKQMQSKARERAIRLWSQPVVAKQYKEVFQCAIDNYCHH